MACAGTLVLNVAKLNIFACMGANALIGGIPEGASEEKTAR